MPKVVPNQYLLIYSLTAAGYLCYLQSVHKMISANCNMPICYELMKLKPQAINILVFVVFFLILFFKAYAIRIIWECYKFLTVQNINRSTLPFIIPEVTGLVEVFFLYLENKYVTNLLFSLILGEKLKLVAELS